VVRVHVAVWYLDEGIFVKTLFAACALSCALAIFAVPISVPASADVVSIAKRYDGMHERRHRGKLKRIIGVDPARTPWCGAWLGTVVRQSGRKPPVGYTSSWAWKRWGRSVGARRGAIAVFKHGHVGVVESIKNGKVCVWSANWRNRVGLSCRKMRTVSAFRG
jgi:uncharacterized protein (TIGR02594 family)